MTENVYPFDNGDPRDEPKRRFELLWFRDVVPALDAHDFVEDLLGDSQFSVVYGESNCGKTFFALDLALHLAQGKPWFNRETRQTGVIYVAMEGGHGIRNRISAFKQHYGLDDAQVSLAVIPQTVSLLNNQADVQALIEEVANAARLIEGPIGLIIFDTLSRALSGGDENSSEDMGALVRNVDLIRKMTNAHVMFIHHSGKDAARGARGHSLVRAATDTEIEVFRDQDSGISTAQVKKQRELETNGMMSFKLLSLEVGRTPRQKPVNSCVLEPLDIAVDRRTKEKPAALPPLAKIALASLTDCILAGGQIPVMNQHIPSNTRCVTIAAWKQATDSRTVAEAKPESQRRAFKRAADVLVERGHIAMWQSLVWLTSKGAKNG
jgi:KaiC/GvpD/RAD55 family RecA-like ATPase